MVGRRPTDLTNTKIKISHQGFLTNKIIIYRSVEVLNSQTDIWLASSLVQSRPGNPTLSRWGLGFDSSRGQCVCHQGVLSKNRENHGQVLP